ncbi:hypothetical protein WA026_021699 [Henosepilachna vigintioctopunctata]|uniref:Uncharacterized protein n=1 Tax=Henosepilachna vigintioctopunctata TaxID=420089 RepID=A0AAW1UCH7_9CUCU
MMKKYCAILVSESFILISIYCIQIGTSVSIPRLSNGKEISDLNKTEIDKLVLQQTEAIKKIVSDKQQVHFEYPQEVKADTELDEQENNTTEVNVEDLKIKCEYLEKLIRANNSKFEEIRQADNIETESAPNIFYRKKFPLQSYPVYFQGRKDNVRATTPKVKGFYITTDSSETTTVSAVTKTSNNVKSNIKYIKLEPVILQKTYLTNGNVVYYWHKSLPSAMHYTHSQKISEKPLETSPTTQPSTTSSSSYSFRNFFPFYPIGNSDSYQTTTESTTTTTTTTTPKNKVYTDFEDLSTHLRFVVPVPSAGADNFTRDPWFFDQFAYYPKSVQPNRVKVEVPYIPTFHVIKALAVPNKYLSDAQVNKVGEVEKSYSKYGPSI